jgi:hypothetical protein
MDGFSDATVEIFGRTREVTIETSRGQGGPVHGAVIWIVVDADGRVLVRSWLREKGHWYREALANPECVVVVDGRSIPVTAELADHPARVEACSAALRAKYGTRSSSARSMVRAEVLPTTLELHPR